MTNEVIKSRTDQIIKWLKNPYNLGLFSVIVFALVVRLYYFLMTLNQPLWWDEAVYMDMARSLAHGLSYKFDPVRPIMFPLIASIFMRLGDTEFLSRLLLLIFSIASVIGMYFMGKEFYDKKVGLIASFLMSVFYLNLFFTYRILIDLQSLTFFIFSAFLFLRYFKTGSKKSLYLASVLIGIGSLFRLTTAVILFGVLIYLLFTERLKIIKKKELWISAAIFLLILAPYIVWGYYTFHGNVITLAGARNAAADNFIGTGVGVMKSYLGLFPYYFFPYTGDFSHYLSISFILVFILGIFLLYKLALGLDLLAKPENFDIKRDLFLLLILIIPFVSMSFLLNHNEDRYIFTFFPAAFLLISNAIIFISSLIKKKNKPLAFVFIGIILVSLAYFQIAAADSLIKNKIDSYAQVKQAGLWLKDNSAPGDYIVTNSYQIRYYSERERIGFPENKSDFEKMLPNESIKYYVISGFESHPDWAFTFPQEKNLSVANAYFSDPFGKNPILVIYRL